MFPSWYHIKRYEEVLIFTCGLLSDPRPLIEHVGEMVVKWNIDECHGVDLSREIHLLKTKGKSVLLLNLVRSLYAEASVPLESKPHHNEMLNFYSHREDGMCGRQRDTTPIEIPSHLYEFNSLLESLPPCNINWDIKTDRNCIVIIYDIPPSVAESVLLTCRQISQNQPITDLWLEGFHCDPSCEVPADVFNLSRTSQSITIANSTLPRDLMGHLISQLPQCKCLKKLYIENIILHNSPSKQTSEEQISNTKLSAASSKKQNQVSKWGLQLGTTSRSQVPILSEAHSIGDDITSEIRKWGDNHPLQQLTMINCLLSRDTCTLITKFKMLTHLNLSGNKLGNAGMHIAKTINNAGLNSLMQMLSVRDCSIPTETCGEILKCLSLCRNLTHLDLGGNNIGNHVKHLVELIKNFGINSPLQQLHLKNCSIQEVDCTEMLKYLCKFRHLIYLNLSGNKLGKGGIHIVEMIDRLGIFSPLQLLYLRDCSIPNHALQKILKSLKKCQHLTHLDLGGHSLECDGTHLVELIHSFGVNQYLQQLHLPNCSIPEIGCTEMLKCLSKYRHLTHLNISGNRVGKGGMHIVQMVERLGLDSPLKLLYLRDCSIPSNTLREILICLKKCKKLSHLDLGGHNLENDGNHLVELIHDFGIDPPLEQLYLPNCSIPEVDCTEILKCLSKYRHLTHLNLDRNRLGKAGIHIVEIVDRFGLDSPLKLLYLRDCLIPSHALQDILKSLKKCQQLTHLDIGGQSLEPILEPINSFGVNQHIQEVHLPNCSIPEVDCTEILKCLCKKYIYLTNLNLSGNRVGTGGIHIVEMIDRLGIDSPLQLLYLRDCSIPNHTLREILKCLKKCQQLTYLDLGGHNLENDGDHLVELIHRFGVNPPLEQLYLPNCSIPELDCTEMLKCLSRYRHITDLNLSGNRVGKGGIHIVEMVNRLGLDSPLQLLYLRDCSIPNHTLQQILKSLKKCKQLAHLDLGGHNLENAVDHLVELIKSFRVDPPLEQLHLPNCLVCEMVVTETVNDCSQQSRCILRILDKCKNLIYLNLEGNNLTGQLSHFLPDSGSTLPSLHNLKLTNVKLNKDDVNHLKTLIESHNMPALGGLDDTHGLWLDKNNLTQIVHELESLLNACLQEHHCELKIALGSNNLSDEFRKKWTKRCEGTHVKLFF